LNMFLQDGIFCYRFGYMQFLKGIMKTREHDATRSQSQGPGDEESSVRSGS
jgi:hypothetical protein